ncbi:MAG: hypothetical protein QHI48_06500 [Bacteroidota bacterium]|nr:hypothetical protein [Bacteroidota bacterium]
MRFATPGFILLWLLVLPSNAQVVQVPLDAGGKIMSVDRSLERRIRLFPEYEGFTAARLFQAPDSSFILEIEMLRDSVVFREKKVLSPLEAGMFRKEVTARILRAAPEFHFDQEGRPRFLIGMAGLAIGFYSWALPTMLGITGMHEDEAAATIAVGTGGMAAGFLIPYLWTGDSRMTAGMATLALQGGYRGIVDGLLLAGLIDPSADVRSAITAEFLASVGETIGGAVIADKDGYTAGSAGIIAAGGNLGLGAGMVSAVLLGWTEGSWESYGRGISALGLAGTAGGYFAGSLMARDARYTDGDVDVFFTAALLGAAIPVSLLVAAEVKETKLYGGAVLVGSTATSFLAHRFLRTRDFSASQGRIVALCSLAGGLLGGGLGYLLTGDEKPERLIAPMTAAGSAAGYVLILSSLDEEARAASSSWSIHISLVPSAPDAMTNSHRTSLALVPSLSFHAVF